MPRLPIFYKGLTPELIEKAEEELNETPQVKTEALNELKELIKNQHDVFCNMEDKYLISFLRAKKYNVQKSLKTLRNYTSLHQKYSGIYTNRLPSEFKTFMDNNILFNVPYRLPDMSHIGGDTLPVRIRGIHIINAPYYTKQLYNVVKLMAKKKFIEKIHFYDNDKESLYKNIPKEYLPQWYGGTLAPVDIEEQARVFYSYEDIVEKYRTYKTTSTMS